MIIFVFAVYVNVIFFVMFRNYEHSTKMFLAGLFVYLCGFLVWNIDNIYCNQLRWNSSCIWFTIVLFNNIYVYSLVYHCIVQQHLFVFFGLPLYCSTTFICILWFTIVLFNNIYLYSVVYHCIVQQHLFVFLNINDAYI